MRKTAKQLMFLFAAGLILQGCHSMKTRQVADYVAEKGSHVEKETTGVWAIEPDPSLPNVLLLGDSISIGYTLGVRDELVNQANVFRPHRNGRKKPENCQGTSYSIKHLDRWLGDRKWQVIHFNWGLHDLKHVHSDSGKNSNNFDDPRQSEPEIYRANLIQLVNRLQATGAKLIFATTTPYPIGVKPARLPADAELYNNIAKQIMNQRNIQINDLYAQALPKLNEVQLPINVHFNKRGRELQAQAVSKVIQRNL